MSISQSPAADIGNVTAVTIILGTLLDLLPALAAIFAIVWYCVLIWESETLRRLTKRPLRKEHQTTDDP